MDRRELNAQDLVRAGIPEKYWDVRFGKIPDGTPYKEKIKKFLKKLPEHLDHGDGMVLWAKETGTGKTALSTIIARFALMYGYTAYYIRASALQTAAIRSHMFSEMQTIEQRARDVDLLILDDLGREHSAASGFTESFVEDVIRERVQRAKSTALTTNLVFPGGLEERYGQHLLSVVGESMLNTHVVPSSEGGVNWRNIRRNQLKDRASY